jgi:MFS family permease
MSSHLIFIAINFVTLLASISSSAISVAYPNIISSFDASLVLAGWVLSIHQLTSMGAMVLVGKISEVFGRKNTFLACVFFFILGSGLCSLAPDIYLLIFFRFLQGIGAGGIVPSAIGIVADQFSKSRQTAIGISLSIYPIGGIVGPNLGGWLTTAFGWRSIFWFNVPFAIGACIPVMLLLKSDPGYKSKIDWIGASLFIISIFAVMTGLSETGSSSITRSWLFVGLLFAVSIIFMIFFLRHEVRTEEPIVDLVFLRNKPFVAANVYNFFFGACAIGFSSFLPLFVVSVYNMSIVQASLVLTARSIGILITATASSFFLVRWGYHLPILIGTVAIAVSFFLMGLEPLSVNNTGAQAGVVALLSAIVLLEGVGSGIAVPAASNACIDLMPKRAASITGLRGMFRQSGGTITIAVISLLLQSIGIAKGFCIIFFGMSIILLAIIPFIFALPGRADQS